MLVVLCSLTVQAQELLDYPLDTVNGEEVYKYEVERSIGLYRIGINFHVSQAEIIRMNPQLKNHGVRYGETLLIPTGRPVVKKKEQPAPVAAPAPVQTEEPAVVKNEVPAQEDTKLQDAINALLNASAPQTAAPANTETKLIELALMLPFESWQTKRSVNADRMLEFYQGALLALQDLQNNGLRFRLHVYDTERSERRVNALCDSTELDSVQGILGPVYPIQIERMAEWCEAHNVPMLLPFSDNAELTKKPQVLQFNSTDRQEADSLCAWIMQRDSMMHCVVVDVREADISESIRTLRERMKVNGIPSSTAALRDLLNDSLDYALDTEKENLIILHSDKYQHVRILMPHLTALRNKGYNLRILSQYSWIKEDISLKQVYTSMFTSTANRDAYDTQWSTYYIGDHVSDVPRFDLLGYDMTRALVAWLQGEKEVNGLQSVIRWQQDENGGYQNAAVKVVEK